MAEQKCWDLYTLGEAMIRLTPPGAQRLEQASELRVYIGGSEANVAVGLARLGMRTAWAGRLPKNPLGMRVAREISAHGADVSQVKWTDTGRVGLYYVEMAGAPRGSRVVYDRQGSTASEMQPADVNPSAIAQARHLHISGITAALSSSCAQTIHHAIAVAKQAGLTVSFDVNYRSRLWSAEAARQALSPVLAVDLVFCTLDDARNVFGQEGAPEAVARSLMKAWGAKMVVLTLGGDGAVVVTEEQTWRGFGHKVDPVDRVGAGDSYVAGFLCGYLDGNIDQAVAFGGAMAAWKYSEPGDFCWATREDIQAMLSEEGKDIRR